MRYIDSWLTGLGLEYVIPKLKANGITTPKKLAQLTLRDMYEVVGVEDAEDRKKLYFLIQRLHSILNKDSPSNKNRLEDGAATESPSQQPSVPSTGHTPDSLGYGPVTDSRNNSQEGDEIEVNISNSGQKRPARAPPPAPLPPHDELMKSTGTTGTERSNGSEEDLRVLRRNRRNSLEAAAQARTTTTRATAAAAAVPVKHLATASDDRSVASNNSAGGGSSSGGPVPLPSKNGASGRRVGGTTTSSSARQIDTTVLNSPTKRPTASTTRAASARNITSTSTSSSSSSSSGSTTATAGARGAAVSRTVSKRIASSRSVRTTSAATAVEQKPEPQPKKPPQMRRQLSQPMHSNLVGSPAAGRQQPQTTSSGNAAATIINRPPLSPGRVSSRAALGNVASFSSPSTASTQQQRQQQQRKPTAAGADTSSAAAAAAAAIMPKVKSMRHVTGVPSPPSPLAVRPHPKERKDLQRRLSANFSDTDDHHGTHQQQQQQRQQQRPRSPSEDLDYAAAYDYDDEVNQYRRSNSSNAEQQQEAYTTDGYVDDQQYEDNDVDEEDEEEEEEEEEDVRNWDEVEYGSYSAADFDDPVGGPAAELDDEAPIEDMAIRVVLRKRPISRKELANGDYDVLEIQNRGTVDVHEPKTKVDLTKVVETQRFVFDDAFDERETNETIYRRTMQHLMRFAFEGGKASCFAYGQTGSGKTFSMMGSRPDAPQEATVNAGLYVLAARDVFALIQEPQYVHLKVMVSCFEIYGGKLFDLLNERGIVRCLEDAKQQVQIKGLTEHEVHNVEELLEIMACAHGQRSTGSTGANDESSRSHQVLQLRIKEPTKVVRKFGRDVMVAGGGGDGGRAPGGKISFIDLAGSERGADTTHASKQTRMEGAEINTSLLALKEVIRSLERKHGHTPFRGSKLTQVLKDSFVGDKTRTCMIACVSPSHSNCEHTLNTLRYADRVKEHQTGGSAAHVGSSNYDSMAYDANQAQRPRTASTAITSSSNSSSSSNADKLNQNDHVGAGGAAAARSRSSLLVKQQSDRPKTASSASNSHRPHGGVGGGGEKENVIMQQRRIESAQNLRSFAPAGAAMSNNGKMRAAGADSGRGAGTAAASAAAPSSSAMRAKSVSAVASRRRSVAGAGAGFDNNNSRSGSNEQSAGRRSLLISRPSQQVQHRPQQQQAAPPSTAAANNASYRTAAASAAMDGSGSTSLDFHDVYRDPTVASGSEKMHRRNSGLTVEDSTAGAGKRLSISVDEDDLLGLPGQEQLQGGEYPHRLQQQEQDEDDGLLDPSDETGVWDGEEDVESGKFDNTEVIQRTVGLLSAHKLAIAEMVEVMKDEMELVQEMENVDDRNSELYIDKLERILAVKSEAIGSLREELYSFQQFRSDTTDCY